MDDPEFKEFMLDLESSLEEKEHTRPTKSNPDLEDLHAIAQNLFEIKGDRNTRHPEVEALRQIANDIAAIVSRTYAERGDYSQLSDDEALMRIRELLLRHDPAIINRNRKRRLPVF